MYWTHPIDKHSRSQESLESVTKGGTFEKKSLKTDSSSNIFKESNKLAKGFL
jgi:hypothetical protein